MNRARTLDGISDTTAARLLDTLAQSIPQAFAFLDRDMRFRIVNARWARICGRSVEDHQGKTPAELLPNILAERIEEAFVQALVTRHARSSLDWPKGVPGAPEFHRLAADAYPIFSGDQPIGAAILVGGDEGGAGAAVAPQEPASSDNGGAEIHRLQSELDRSLKIRDALLTMASHDVRGSLAALRLTANALVRTFRSDKRLSDEEIESALLDLDREAASLLGMIEKLVAYSAITSSNLVLQRASADLAEIAAAAASSVRDEAAAAGCEIRVVAPSAVPGRWDRPRVLQAATNLVQNAVRHAAPGPVEVKAALTGATARLSVTDRGPGIPASVVDTAFEPFVHGTGKGRGFGLGLWIARRIAELHGGRLLLETGEKKGTHIVLELPVEIPSGR